MINSQKKENARTPKVEEPELEGVQTWMDRRANILKNLQLLNCFYCNGRFGHGFTPGYSFAQTTDHICNFCCLKLQKIQEFEDSIDPAINRFDLWDNPRLKYNSREGGFIEMRKADVILESSNVTSENIKLVNILLERIDSIEQKSQETIVLTIEKSENKISETKKRISVSSKTDYGQHTPEKAEGNKPGTNMFKF